MLTSRSMVVAAALLVAAFASILVASGHHQSTGSRVVSPGGAVSSPAAGVVPTSRTAVPSEAVVRVGPGRLVVAVDHRDVTYQVCAGAQADAAVGEFVHLSLAGGCVSRVQAAPAATPVCTSSGSGSYVDGTWVGANASAHSVLYRVAAGARPTLAAQWCQAPAVLSAGGGTVALAQIAPGSAVRVVSSAGGWVTEVIVQHGVRERG